MFLDLSRDPIHRRALLTRIRSFSLTTNDATTTVKADCPVVIVGCPVVIVGGGPTGLFMAHMLQSYRVPFVLLEAQTPQQRFQHPQAHFLNTRSMEILKNASQLHPSSSSMYKKIREAMPPVEEWKSFLFGPDMTSRTERMAKVVHPVDRPLLANTDANGVLASDTEGHEISDNDVPSSSFPLSDVSVGHLAQHTFCKILYDAVTEASSGIGTSEGETLPANKILYGNRVVSCDWDDAIRQWTIQTDKDITCQTSIVIAADGARSFLRDQVLQIPMDGQAAIQNLMNVHFRVSEETERQIPKAMLYTVFSSQVLAMVVRHGAGEYVMQIPYFVPYQTPEQDFTTAKVKEMVRSALGCDGNVDFEIRSIRPWTMGSLVARDYYSEKGVYLVGDTAHVFPPAGGFGMNTGLQDVFSLAWRLALLHKNAKCSQNNDKATSLEDVGYLYQRERQSVARDNAALSVRNYQRVLGVVEACYLNHQHPTALIAALNATSFFVPLGSRQQTFRTLLQMALLPMGQLKSSSHGFFARRVKSNLQRLLGSGQGLPLLFPKHEVDFSYSENTGRVNSNNSNCTNDSKASAKRLSVGGLFPHMVGRVTDDMLKRFPRLSQIESFTHTATMTESGLSLVSTRDLAIQLSPEESPCAFCLGEILFSRDALADSSKLRRLSKNLQDSLSIPVVPLRIVVAPDDDYLAGILKKEVDEFSCCNVVVDKKEWEAVKVEGVVEGSENSILWVVIRSDGHVASLSRNSDAESIVHDVRRVLYKDFR